MTDIRFSDKPQLVDLDPAAVLPATSVTGGPKVGGGSVPAGADVGIPVQKILDAAAEAADVAIEDAISALAPQSSAVAIQFTADTGSTSDADPGAGKLRWNHATQGSASFLYLDDSSADGVGLTSLWPALHAGGTIFLQHGTDQDTWQIWEITAITDASGYAKLAVTNLVNGGSFADGDPILVTIDRAQSSTGGVSSVNGASGAVVLTHAGLTTTQTVTSASTVTPVATEDKVVISAQAVALTIANPSGTAAEGQGFVIALKDNGTARGITFGSDYRAMGMAALPTTTVISKWMYIPVMYNPTDAKWDVFPVSQQA